MEEITLYRNNRKLKFSIIGQGDPVFIVGFAHYTYRLLSPELSSRYMFILHDYFGLIQDPDIHEMDLSLPNLLDDIKFIQSYVDLKKMNIFGHSSSGTVALDYALNNPHLINTLCMICSPILFDKKYMKIQYNNTEKNLSGERKTVFEKNMIEFKKRNDMNLVKDYFKEFHAAQTPLYFYDFNSTPPDYWEGININPDFITHFVDKTYDVYKREKDIMELKTQLVSIIGKYDFATPCATWDTYTSLLNIILFEYSSHYPMLEEVEKFNDIIISNLG